MAPAEKAVAVRKMIDGAIAMLMGGKEQYKAGNKAFYDALILCAEKLLQ